MTNLVETILGECKLKLSQPSGIESSLDDVFDGDHCRPFHNLRTAYQQTKFIKNNLPYVVSSS